MQLLACAKLVSGFAVGANKHARAQFLAIAAAPELKSARSDKLEIVEMRMHAEDFHAGILRY